MKCEQIRDDLARRRRLIAEERLQFDRLNQRHGPCLDALPPDEVLSAMVAIYGTAGGQFQFRRTGGRPQRWSDRLPLLELLAAKADDPGVVRI